MNYSYSKSDRVSEWTVDRFAGVDFSTEPTKVDDCRSPDACNMIADATFFPVKRTGYRREYKLPDKIYGMHRFGNDMLVHSGNRLYTAADGAATELYDDMNTERSVSFVMRDRLWILDGKTYLVYDGNTVSKVRDNAFIPTTTIGAPPEGGGTSFEAVNLLTPYRINTFVGDGDSVTFHLDCTDIDRDSVTCPGYKIFSVNTAMGIVTLETAPKDEGGLANLVIKFAKTMPENEDKINKCRTFGMYGGSNDTRVFLSGNPNEPNADWQSGLYDPSYFPDNGYTKVGSDSSAILGYMRQYDSQLVLKEDGQDAKQYLRSFALDEDNKPMYSLKQGAEAAGALGFDSFGVLNDVPMYISSEGVMGVYGTNVSGQRSISCVSARINKRLLEEPNLKNAVVCCHQNRLYLAVNGHCYIADGKQMSNGIPEWYFWDNIPATCFLSEENQLRFGTDDGRVCCFCREGDRDAYYDDGEAIFAKWSTPFSALGSWNRNKNILAFYPVLMPYRKTSAQVIFRTNKSQNSREAFSLRAFSFTQFDFADLSFNTILSAKPIALHKRQRRTFLFQGIVENRQAGEPFGVLGMVTRYTIGNPIHGK